MDSGRHRPKVSFAGPWTGGAPGALRGASVSMPAPPRSPAVGNYSPSLPSNLPRPSRSRHPSPSRPTASAIRSVRSDDPEDGQRSLRELVARLVPKAAEVRALAAELDAAIRWSAHSDSTQGGFVLNAELLAGIAALGVPLFGTVGLVEG